jgi:DNA-binding response OmpR family regulator
VLIYIAYEEPQFSQQLAPLLLSQKHVIELIALSDGILKRFASNRPDLLVITSSKREMTVEFLQLLRADRRLQSIPVLCVNPRGASSDGVALLDAGADDFMNRPFDTQIFVARVRTLLRRQIWSGQLNEEVTVLTSGPIELRLVSRQALLSGRRLDLTRLEFDLLSFLLREPDRVFERSDILRTVWNYPPDVETRTLEKHIEVLRKKMGRSGEFIQTIHGVGYQFSLKSPTKKT